MLLSRRDTSEVRRLLPSKLRYHAVSSTGLSFCAKKRLQVGAAHQSNRVEEARRKNPGGVLRVDGMPHRRDLEFGRLIACAGGGQRVADLHPHRVEQGIGQQNRDRAIRRSWGRPLPGCDFHQRIRAVQRGQLDRAEAAFARSIQRQCPRAAAGIINGLCGGQANRPGKLLVDSGGCAGNVRRGDIAVPASQVAEAKGIGRIAEVRG